MSINFTTVLPEVSLSIRWEPQCYSQWVIKMGEALRIFAVLPTDLITLIIFPTVHSTGLMRSFSSDPPAMHSFHYPSSPMRCLYRPPASPNLSSQCLMFFHGSILGGSLALSKSWHVSFLSFSACCSGNMWATSLPWYCLQIPSPAPQQEQAQSSSWEMWWIPALCARTCRCGLGNIHEKPHLFTTLILQSTISLHLLKLREKLVSEDAFWRQGIYMWGTNYRKRHSCFGAKEEVDKVWKHPKT